MGLLIAAANLGFLGHNWPPARIFMGDVGSAFLGFSFAALSLWAWTCQRERTGNGLTGNRLTGHCLI